MVNKITELGSAVPKKEKKGNPIPATIEGDERKVIARRAGENARKNNAIVSRFKKNLNYHLFNESKIEDITQALIEAATNPKGRNFLGAVRLIFGAAGIDCEVNNKQGNQSITGENIQVVFTGNTDQLAK